MFFSGLASQHNDAAQHFAIFSSASSRKPIKLLNPVPEHVDAVFFFLKLGAKQQTTCFVHSDVSSAGAEESCSDATWLLEERAQQNHVHHEFAVLVYEGVECCTRDKSRKRSIDTA